MCARRAPIPRLPGLALPSPTCYSIVPGTKGMYTHKHQSVQVYPVQHSSTRYVRRTANQQARSTYDGTTSSINSRNRIPITQKECTINIEYCCCCWCEAVVLVQSREKVSKKRLLRIGRIPSSVMHLTYICIRVYVRGQSTLLSTAAHSTPKGPRPSASARAACQACSKAQRRQCT